MLNNKVSEGRNACSMLFQICREHTWILWEWMNLVYRSNLPQSQLAIAKDDNLDFQDTNIFSKSSHLKVLKGPRKRNGVSACPTAWLDASDPCRDSPLAKLDQGTEP